PETHRTGGVSRPIRARAETHGRPETEFRRTVSRSRNFAVLFHRHSLGLKRTIGSAGPAPCGKARPRLSWVRGRPISRAIALPDRSPRVAGRRESYQARYECPRRSRRP